MSDHRCISGSGTLTGVMRRRMAIGACAAATALLIGACSSATSTGGSHASTNVTAWLVTTGPSPANTAITNAAASFDKSHPGDNITVNFVENQSYKQKIQTAMLGKPPTIFWTWGGGPLDQFIKAGDVQALGHPSWVSQFLPSSLGNVTFSGRLYGVPVEGTQPVYFFYNKSVLSSAGISTFPATWSGLLSAVATLKAHGVTPISLAEGDQWPGLMYLEYLSDRIGGPGAFNAIEAGKKDAWSSPPIISALTDIQQLVKAGAFQTGYDSLHYSGGGSDALVYSGKAGMQLMGDWDISSLLGADSSFVTAGDLGMASFPTVPGETGNPRDLAGNTASYISIASHATAAQKSVAEEFMQDVLVSKDYAKASIAAGEVPVVSGASPLFKGQQLASFDQTIYTSVQHAPNFQYSWDQALPSTAEADTMLTDLSEVFTLSMTPQQFATTMDAAES
jgi:raffinose/stachyose/melibiose transport system substrate-binding protein